MSGFKFGALFWAFLWPLCRPVVSGLFFDSLWFRKLKRWNFRTSVGKIEGGMGESASCYR